MSASGVGDRLSSGMAAAEFGEYLEAIRRFTQEELIPAEQRVVELGRVPEDVLQRIRDVGLFGITLPRQFGGLELSMEQQVRLTMEFTQASAVYRSHFSTTIGLCSQLLLDHGTAAQRERFLRAMACGKCVAAFALTEAGAGSDVRAVKTEAKRVSGGYVLTGEKRFITNGAWADVLLVAARVAGSAAGQLSVFIVDARSAGVECCASVRMNGYEAAPVAEIRLEGVFVETQNLVGGQEGNGLAQLLRGINHARTHVAATAVGQAMRLQSEGTRHCCERSQFGKRLADMEVIQARLGRCLADIMAGRALVLECARAFDTGTVIPRDEIAAAKYFCTEMAFRVADQVLQLLGGEGVVGDSAVPRMWRDVRALRIYEGTSEIHERNLGRRAVFMFEQSLGPMAGDVVTGADNESGG